MTHWALHYLGRPWVSGESDCYALVRTVYREVRSEELPHFDLTQADPLALRRAMEAASGWLDVPAPADLDVVLMSHGARPHHVGLWAEVDGGRVLHSVERAGVVAPSVPALTAAGWRILGYRRRA